jgi:LPS export ABC transporter protein LptC
MFASVFHRNLIALIFLLAFILTACENDIEKVKLLSEHKIAPVESASVIRILYSDSAKVQVEITARELNHFETDNPYVEMPKGFQANFFDDSLKVKSTLTADYGIRYEREQKMEARKNVVVVNEKGEMLNTEHLIWDEKTEKLKSDEFVKITKKGEIIMGTGFEANQDFSKYKIFNIKGTIPINQNDHAPNS